MSSPSLSRLATATTAAIALLLASAPGAVGAADADRVKVAPGVFLAGAETFASSDASPPEPFTGDHAPPEARSGERIVGGTATEIAKWPWQAAIALNYAFYPSYNAFERQICGGALVAPRVVISAAHCFYDAEQGKFDLAIGYSVITGRTLLSGSSGQEAYVLDYYGFVDGAGQPLYDRGTNEWDVVIVELSAPSYSAPIKIAGADEAALWEPGRALFATGWGLTSEGGSKSDGLRQVQIQRLADSTCGSEAVYGGSFLPEVMVCAGVLAGGRDSCQGDSGGPLVAPIKDGGFRLVGDTSFGYGCARANRPGVYGRVAEDPMLGSLRNGILSLFGIDVTGAGGTPPPQPETAITGVTVRSKRRRASFSFSASAPSSFSCQLDARPWAPCSSPRGYRRLRRGAHTFRVFATAGVIADPTPAVRRFRVK